MGGGGYRGLVDRIGKEIQPGTAIEATTASNTSSRVANSLTTLQGQVACYHPARPGSV